MIAWLGMLIAIDRLAPGTLPRPATVAARERARSRPSPLRHICREHRRMSDAPCRPGCTSLCGKVTVAPSDPRPYGTVSPADICVVCIELFDWR